MKSSPSLLTTVATATIIIAIAIIKILFSSTHEDYQYNDYYYQKTDLFEYLPIDSTDIVFVGNSLIDHCEWHELFNNPHIKNRGINSDVSMGIYDRLNTITAGKPAKIFLLIGVNDISHNLSTDSIVGNILNIIRAIRQSTPTTQLYVQSLLPINESFGKYRKMKGKSAQIIAINLKLWEFSFNEDYTYIDLYSHLTTPGSHILNPDYTNDGLHLLGKGYIVWRNVLLPYIEH